MAKNLSPSPGATFYWEQFPADDKEQIPPPSTWAVVPIKVTSFFVTSIVAV